MSEDNNHNMSLDSEAVRDIVRDTVVETLTTMGLDASDLVEVQKDMHFIRELRSTSDAMKTKGILVLVGAFMTALVAAIWLGVKSSLGTP